MSANDRQVAGDHYDSPVQHWDYAASNHFDYFQGCITKYIHRWRDKGGVDDLKKAAHYLEKYIELAEGSLQPPTSDDIMKEINKITDQYAREKGYPSCSQGRSTDIAHPFGYSED